MDLERLSFNQLLILVDSDAYAKLTHHEKLKVLDRILEIKAEKYSALRNKRYVAMRSKSTLDMIE
jgi:hypothetical protein